MLHALLYITPTHFVQFSLANVFFSCLLYTTYGSIEGRGDSGGDEGKAGVGGVRVDVCDGLSAACVCSSFASLGVRLADGSRNDKNRARERHARSIQAPSHSGLPLIASRVVGGLADAKWSRSCFSYVVRIRAVFCMNKVEQCLLNLLAVYRRSMVILTGDCTTAD